MVMVQAEVAERLAAEPGGKDYGVPSAKVRFYGNVRRYGMVSPTVFWPIPRVYSGLVRLDRYETSPWPTEADFRKQVFDLIDIAFAQRRKTSRNAFAEWAGSGNESADGCSSASIDPSRRGETLGIADFVRLLQRSGYDPKSQVRLSAGAQPGHPRYSVLSASAPACVLAEQFVEQRRLRDHRVVAGDADALRAISSTRPRTAYHPPTSVGMMTSNAIRFQ